MRRTGSDIILRFNQYTMIVFWWMKMIRAWKTEHGNVKLSHHWFF